MVAGSNFEKFEMAYLCNALSDPFYVCTAAILRPQTPKPHCGRYDRIFYIIERPISQRRVARLGEYLDEKIMRQEFT